MAIFALELLTTIGLDIFVFPALCIAIIGFLFCVKNITRVHAEEARASYRDRFQAFTG